MSIDNIESNAGDRAVSNNGLSVSLEDFAAFGALGRSSGSSDVTALGFPSIQAPQEVADISGALSRCTTLGVDAGACVKSVRRHLV